MAQGSTLGNGHRVRSPSYLSQPAAVTSPSTDTLKWGQGTRPGLGAEEPPWPVGISHSAVRTSVHLCMGPKGQLCPWSPHLHPESPARLHRAPDEHDGLISADWRWQGARGHPEPSRQALSGPGSGQPLDGKAKVAVASQFWGPTVPGGGGGAFQAPERL